MSLPLAACRANAHKDAKLHEKNDSRRAWRIVTKDDPCEAGASPVPKVCQNAIFFGLLGLALSEKQSPQIIENTMKAKWQMEPLESVGTRPRQARYQAALRPDMKFVLIIRHWLTRMLLHQTNLALNCAKTVPK
ncbi:MAG: hypothetical protein ACRD4X_14350 [Candidatus Acidiferrales bacterium]